MAAGQLDAMILHYWPIITFIGASVIWFTRLEARVKNNMEKLIDLRSQQDRLAERIAKDLDSIKDDSAIIKATLEGIQGYIKATREFQERNRS